MPSVNTKMGKSNGNDAQNQKEKKLLAAEERRVSQTHVAEDTTTTMKKFSDHILSLDNPITMDSINDCLREVPEAGTTEQKQLTCDNPSHQPCTKEQRSRARTRRSPQLFGGDREVIYRYLRSLLGNRKIPSGFQCTSQGPTTLQTNITIVGDLTVQLPESHHRCPFHRALLKSMGGVVHVFGTLHDRKPSITTPAERIDYTDAQFAPSCPNRRRNGECVWLGG